MADKKEELSDKDMVDELNKMDRDLNSWEAEFHNSCMEILYLGDSLSSKDHETLKRIYERYLGEDAGIDETVDDVDF